MNGDRVRRSNSHDIESESEMRVDFQSSLLPQLDPMMCNVSELDELLDTIGQTGSGGDEEMGGLQLDLSSDGLVAHSMIKQEIEDGVDQEGAMLTMHPSMRYVMGPSNGQIMLPPGGLRLMAPGKPRLHAPHCPLHACGCGRGHGHGPGYNHGHAHGARVQAPHGHPRAAHCVMRAADQSSFRTVLRVPSQSVVHAAPLRPTLLTVVRPQPVLGAPVIGGNLVLTVPQSPRTPAPEKTAAMLPLTVETDNGMLRRTASVSSSSKPASLKRNGESDTNLVARGLLAKADSAKPQPAARMSVTSASASKSSSKLGDSNVGNDTGDSGETILSRLSPTPTLEGSVTPTVSGRRKLVDKASDEYRLRRERNNVAVRKSREKAKYRHEDTSRRVKDLTFENDQLVRKLESVLQELSLLKSLFQKLGAPIPECVVNAQFANNLPKSISKLLALRTRGSSATANTNSSEPASEGDGTLNGLCNMLNLQSSGPTEALKKDQRNDESDSAKNSAAPHNSPAKEPAEEPRTAEQTETNAKLADSAS